MTKYWILILLLTALFGCANNEAEKDEEQEFHVLTSKYIDQKAPGLKPEIFAPNSISTGMDEINSAFSPDFDEFYYSIRMPNKQLVIMMMKYDGTQWSAPEVAPFSGEYSDADPFISYDGNWLYYISQRPVDSTKDAKTDWDIWRVRKHEEGWSEPEWLDNMINSEADETYPSLTEGGTLYFSSKRIDRRNGDIYSAKKLEDRFEKPVRLNDTINNHWEGDIFISKNEDYMIFSSFGREAGSGLYITFNQDGKWSLPQRMSEEINATGREFCPIVSPDGKYFFFTSNQATENNDSSEKLTYQKMKDDFVKSYSYPQMGSTDIYWVDVKTIEKYRNKSH